MGALTGIKVLDLSRLLPGPYCSMILADHGAEVVAIEDRRFQEDDLFFGDIYRNKRHVTLNLKSEQGKEIFSRLVSTVDIIIEGFRPGVVDRLGVGYAQLSKQNPALIYCSITGYGQEGDEDLAAGHDVNYLSRAGVLNQIGEADKRPVIPAVQIADIAGGAMNAVIGILLALHERNFSGKGQYIDISMTDGVLGFLTLPHILAKKSGQQQNRSNSMLSHQYGCYNTYETADGRYLAIGAVENRFWNNLCSLLEVDEYGSQQYDNEKRLQIIEHLRDIFLSQPLEHWEQLLGKADVCFTKIQTIAEVLTDPLFTAREMIVDASAEDSSEKSFGIPVKLSRTPGKIRSAPQPFGSATNDVLSELGYSADQIASFYRDGAV